MTVVDARTPEPPRSLVSQVGTRLVAWNPPPCGGGRGCLAYVFLRSSFGALRPTPLSVAAGKGIGIQLNYRLGVCVETFAADAG